MAVKDTLKFYCCTLQGLLRLKLIIGLVLGLLIMLAAILTLINPLALLNPFNYLRQVWNAVFGFLILAAQPGWQKIPICSKILGRLVTRFGFLHHWLGRGLFELLCAPPLVPSCHRSVASSARSRGSFFSRTLRLLSM